MVILIIVFLSIIFYLLLAGIVAYFVEWSDDYVTIADSDFKYLIGAFWPLTFIPLLVMFILNMQDLQIFKDYKCCGNCNHLEIFKEKLTCKKDGEDLTGIAKDCFWPKIKIRKVCNAWESDGCRKSDRLKLHELTKEENK